MYIDTHTKMSMEHSICNYLEIVPAELNRLFDQAQQAAQTGSWFDCCIFDEIINEFVALKLPNHNYIDQILFYHLSRRLNSECECNIGSNLFDLLTTKNSVSIFLKEHDVEFIPDEGRLELLYKGRKVPLNDSMDSSIPYLKGRLGHNHFRADYCFNGFMLKDLIYRNTYARDLFGAPEFIESLGNFLHRTDLLNDYLENSTYYCFEYKVPLHKVLFDQEEKLSNSSKPLYLINRVLHRLFEYYTSDLRYMFDHSNPIIRLMDDDTMLDKYFISKEEITYEMLE